MITSAPSPSSHDAPRRCETGQRAIALAILCLCGLVIAFARPRLFIAEARVKERSDAYALPPSNVLPAVSLGYRDALADMIWAHVLVTQGLRFGEKRAFDHLDL